MVSMPRPLRVLVLGTPEFAVPTLQALLDSPHLVVGVVTQPDRPRGRGHQVQPPPVKVLALAHGVPVWQPERIREPGFLEAMRALDLDLGVVAAYGKILPEACLEVPRLGMINVHASLLPRWRGASPIAHAVMAGDAETGVTIMRVVKALDAGAMFARVTRPIGPRETAGEVEDGLARLGAGLLVEIVDALAAGTSVETPQDEALVTYAPRLTRDAGRIDWRQPAEVIERQVRGLLPWPGAFAGLGGQRLAIRRAHVETPSTDAPSTGAPSTGAPPADAAGAGAPSADGARAAEPGRVLVAGGGRLVVACGAGSSLALDELQLPGKRAMATRDFLAGHVVAVGESVAAPPAPSAP
jgi:methionyl-tRNA formyltransferase